MDNSNDTKDTNKASSGCVNELTLGPFELVAQRIPRMSPEEYDELYMQSYLDNPEQSKVETLRSTGHPNPSRQRAWQIHDRLADQIDKRLDKLIMQDAALGRSVLVNLAKTSTSESVKAACASRLMEYAGKQKPDRLIIENRTPEDIDSEIAAVQKRILLAQGDDIPEGELH